MAALNQKNKIKEVAEEFFSKITMPALSIDVDFTEGISFPGFDSEGDNKTAVSLNIRVEDPQILIGQGGQTLSEVQRLLRMVLKKKFPEENLYFNVDINDYKKKKTEYLKDVAKDLANEVALTKEEKILNPMSSYERRIIHSELSRRQDVSTESQGMGLDRYIVIKPK